MDYNTLSTFLFFIFIIGMIFFVAFIGISVIVIGFIVTLLFSCSPDSKINKEGENYSVEQLVKINKNFQDSGRIINSEAEAKKYKILSGDMLSDDMINKYVELDYKGKILYTKIAKNKSLLCFKTISELGEAYKINRVNIRINNEPINKVIRSQSNIEYVCDQNETIIENHLKKDLD